MPAEYTDANKEYYAKYVAWVRVFLQMCLAELPKDAPISNTAHVHLRIQKMYFNGAEWTKIAERIDRAERAILDLYPKLRPINDTVPIYTAEILEENKLVIYFSLLAEAAHFYRNYIDNLVKGNTYFRDFLQELRGSIVTIKRCILKMQKTPAEFARGAEQYDEKLKFDLEFWSSIEDALEKFNWRICPHPYRK